MALIKARDLHRLHGGLRAARRRDDDFDRHRVDVAGLRLIERHLHLLRDRGVEFRRGLSGGGNQLRQPYLAEYRKRIDLADFQHVEHVHFHGFYVGNSPDIETEGVRELCAALNELPSG